jgi:chromosome partitioning protein
MGWTISLANQKGGVGKSTTAQALWAGLHLKGYRVLLIDIDPQGNTTYTVGITSTTSTAYELLTRKAHVKDTIVNTPNGDIIPSNKQLIKLDLELISTGKEYKLKEALETVKEEYDFIVIDTPPALGILTVNALTASDNLIIPAQAEIYSLQGIGDLYDTINAVKKYCNPNLKIKGILLTRHNSRTILSRDMFELIGDIARQINTFVYKTIIREGVVIKEAQASQRDIFTYSFKSNVSKDYLSFINEFLERNDKDD